MKMKSLIFLLLFVHGLLQAQSKYQKDFLEFWNDVNDNYAYLKEQKIDWEKVKQIYEPRATHINTDDEFIAFLEELINELHNGHNSLNTNLSSSNRIIPSGQDLFMENINDQYIITDIRKDSKAEKADLKVGMRVTKFNDQKIIDQLKKFLPKFTSSYTPAMSQYALNMLFAGTHDIKRKITVDERGVEKDYYPDAVVKEKNNDFVTTRILNKNTAYIKINNSLFNNQLIGWFDGFIDTTLRYKNLVIDLTETPGGGNTTVARAIMGRFITETLPYQKHQIDEPAYETRRQWTEYVGPRKQIFKGNVYVLVGHWTGSMGEGIAIGFDALKRAKIIGTKMAGLLGAIENFQLSETKIGYQFPTEKLFHVNGTPREAFVPSVLTKNIFETYQFMNQLK